VRTTEAGGPKGYDGAKRASGRERHLLVDTLGLLVACIIHTAYIQDEDGAREVLARGKARFPRLKLVWGDSRYACERLPERVWLWFRWVLAVVRPA
jgi:putative transposase